MPGYLTEDVGSLPLIRTRSGLVWCKLKEDLYFLSPWYYILRGASSNTRATSQRTLQSDTTAQSLAVLSKKYVSALDLCCDSGQDLFDTGWVGCMLPLARMLHPRRSQQQYSSGRTATSRLFVWQILTAGVHCCPVPI